MRFSVTILLLAICLSISSCRQDKGRGEVVIASAYGQNLYPSDIEGLVGEGVSPQDSAAIVENYINQWLQQQVVINEAQQNVTKDFAAELQNYKNSLLIYEYEQMVVNQKLDTNVTESEIKKYYDSHQDHFLLTTSIVKAIYVKVPKDAPALKDLSKWMVKGNFTDDDFDNVQKMALSNGYECAFDADHWMPLYRFQSLLPIQGDYGDVNLRGKRFLKVPAEDFIYLAHIFDYRPTGELSPMDYERENIKAVILNSRKIDIIRQMQTELLKKAESRGEINKK